MERSSGGFGENLQELVKVNTDRSKALRNQNWRISQEGTFSSTAQPGICGRHEGCYSQLGKSKQLKYELKNRVFAPSSKILATKVMNATTNACMDALNSKRLKIGNINSPFFLVRCHWCLRNGRLAFCGLLENQLLTRQRGRKSKCDLMVSRSTQEYKVASILLVLLLCICVCFLQCCSHRFVNRSAAFMVNHGGFAPLHIL